MRLYSKIQIHLPLYGLLRRLPAEDPKQVLILCDDALGDLLMMSGITKQLKAQGYSSTLVVRDTWQDIAQLMEGVSRVIAVNLKQYKSSLRYRIHILNQIRNVHYHWAAASIFPSTVNADLLTYCGATQRYACRWDNSWHEKRRTSGATCKLSMIPTKINKYVRTDILDLLAHYYSGILHKPVHKESIQPALSSTLVEPPQFIEEKYLLYISDTMSGCRRYPCEQLLSVLLPYAQENHLKIVVTAKEANPHLLQHPAVINLTGKTTLYELWQLIYHAQLVVGNETGSTHLAWICGKRTIMIYGGGPYGLFRPAEPCQLVYHPMACYGCEWDTCPHGMDNPAPCILAITPAQIEQALRNEKAGLATHTPFETEFSF